MLKQTERKRELRKECKRGGRNGDKRERVRKSKS